MARLVVGTAILRDGRVLAARKATTAPGAGRWELPGGKVEPGESPDDAVRREVAEELGATVEVTGWLPGRVPVGPDLELAVATARLVAGEPAAHEHDLLRWLGAEDLESLDWLEPDRPFLVPLAAALRADPAAAHRRAVLFEADDARAVTQALHRDGWSAELVRERLAGEDDDEDHPWAVLTDAPAPVVEVLLETHEGWLDDPGEPAGTGVAMPASGPAAGRRLPPPPPLPTAPRRLKRDPDPSGPGGLLG